MDELVFFLCRVLISDSLLHIRNGYVECNGSIFKQRPDFSLEVWRYYHVRRAAYRSCYFPGFQAWTIHLSSTVLACNMFKVQTVIVTNLKNLFVFLLIAAVHRPELVSGVRHHFFAIVNGRRRASRNGKTRNQDQQCNFYRNTAHLVRVELARAVASGALERVPLDSFIPFIDKTLIEEDDPHG